MHNTTPSIAHAAQVLPAINASAIADTNFDGSQSKSTLWLAVLAPVLMAATLTSMLFGKTFSHIAGGVCLAVLMVLLSKFPTSASSRFITFNFKRPHHFIPTACGLAIATLLAVVSAAQIQFAEPYGLSGNTAGHFAALFMALSITTGGRYALNFVAMTERLLVLLFCWGGSVMVADTTLLAFGAIGLSLNLLWSIQSRWTPKIADTVVVPKM